MSDKVMVLGGTGMVGHQLVATLEASEMDVTATARNLHVMPSSTADVKVFDILSHDIGSLVAEYGPGDTVVNCTGVIKPYINDDDVASRLLALEVNAVFPHKVAALAATHGFRFIHVTTDCVFSGAVGNYREDQTHDSLDVYGRSKSLGEAPGPTVLNLRCSVIGPELHSFVSLMHWVLGHKDGDSLPGFLDHLWSGVTTDALAKIIAGVIRTNNPLTGTVHVVPGSTCSKADLIRMILAAYGRDAVTVVPTTTDTPVDRTLSTVYPTDVARLWEDAGYRPAPTIEQMVTDMASAHQRN